MTGLLLRVVLVILVIRALWRLVGGVIRGLTAGDPQGASPPLRSVPLVRDPVCGTYIPKSRALTSGSGERAEYFCSERCRDAYAPPSR